VRLTSLHLEQFRNYSSQEVTFEGASTQIFVGENGSGKTNLLEAISVLSLTKSCRGRDDDELVQWEQSHYRVRGTARTDAGDDKTLEVVCEIRPRKRKACFVNDVRTNAAGFVGVLPTVIFLPQDLLLFSGPPAERRRFLDQLLSQVSPQYLAELSAYQKVLQQRNALLRAIAEGEQQPDALIPWDTQLSAHGSHVTVARLELMETLNLLFAAELAAIGEVWPDVRLRYARKTAETSADAIEREMREMLERNRARELAMLSTSVGPHREDWQAYVEDRPVPTFASRGQERSAVLALLLLEVSYLELRRGEKPVVLLDDAFSELDDRHQASLLSALGEHQVLLTSTRVPPGLGGIDVRNVANGTID
jgi:DNA replication and repair protein RecF